MKKEVTLDSKVGWEQRRSLWPGGLGLAPALLPRPHPKTVPSPLCALIPLPGFRRGGVTRLLQPLCTDVNQQDALSRAKCCRPVSWTGKPVRSLVTLHTQVDMRFARRPAS